MWYYGEVYCNVVLLQSVLHLLAQARLHHTGLRLLGADATNTANMVTGRECVEHGSVPVAKPFACSDRVYPNRIFIRF